MELNKNSAVAKLYRWFYDTEEMPQSICTYFWKLFFLWLSIIPRSIFTSPSYIYSWLSKDKEISPSRRNVLSIIIYVVLIVTASIIAAIYALIVNPTIQEMPAVFNVLAFIGFIILFLGIVIAVIVFFAHFFAQFIIWSLNQIRKPNNKFRTKPKVIIEYLRAKKNKVCPKITWK